MNADFEGARPAGWPPRPFEVWTGRSGAKYMANESGYVVALGDDAPWLAPVLPDLAWAMDGPLKPPNPVGLSAHLRRDAHQRECRLDGTGDATLWDLVREDAALLRQRADSITPSWPL